jgi:parvulin-like peptidyl-prolyl isomerase
MTLPPVARAILREPLTQFLLIGLALFVVASVARDLRRPVVRIDEAELQQLVAYWEAQAQRPPTPDELRAMLRERIDEELLSREAVRLGLDREDLIIRRRLAQKMAFASEDLERVPEPTEADLRTWYEAHPKDYVAPATVTFRHIFFSGDAEGSEAQARAALSLPRPAEAGQTFVLPLSYSGAAVRDIERDYGPAFSRQVETAPEGKWIGPVKSAYGWHILRVERRALAETLPFESVRSDLADAWKADRRTQANQAFIRKLRARYRVEVAGMATPPAT